MAPRSRGGGVEGEGPPHQVLQPNYNWIGWNEQRPWFSDPKVRQAMNHAIDTEAVRKKFLLGLDRPTTCHFYLDSSAAIIRFRLAPTIRRGPPSFSTSRLAPSRRRRNPGEDGQPFRFTF